MNRRSFLRWLGISPAVIMLPNIKTIEAEPLVPSVTHKGVGDIVTGAWPQGGQLYVSLHTAEPDLGPHTEVSYEGYKRVAVDRNTQSWEVSCDEEDDYVTASNQKAIEFHETPKDSEQFKVQFFGVSASKDGEPLFQGRLNRPVHNAGLSTFKFLPGSITMSVW